MRQSFTVIERKARSAGVQAKFTESPWRQKFRCSDWMPTKRSLCGHISTVSTSFIRMSWHEEPTKHQSIFDRNVSTTTSLYTSSSLSDRCAGNSHIIQELLNDMDHTTRAGLGTTNTHSSNLQATSQLSFDHSESTDARSSTQSPNGRTCALIFPRLPV